MPDDLAHQLTTLLELLVGFFGLSRLPSVSFFCCKMRFFVLVVVQHPDFCLKIIMSRIYSSAIRTDSVYLGIFYEKVYTKYVVVSMSI